MKLRLLLPALAFSILLPACSSSDDGPTPDPVDPALVSNLRDAVTAQGIQVAPAAPSLSMELVELGRALYFDKELSGNRDVSCATCHLASRFGSDGRTLPRGVAGLGVGPGRAGGAIIPRHSPMNLNPSHGEAMFWDGRVERPGGVLSTPAGAQLTAAMQSVFPAGLETLAAQAMFPPTSRAEMRGEAPDNEIANVADGDFTGIWAAIVARITGIVEYENMLGDAFPGTLVGDIHMGHLGAAMAAFQAVELHRIDSPFQAFLEGDDTAMSNDQLRGALAYFNPGSRCTVCHNGPLFSDFGFHNIGMPQLGPGKGNGIGMDDDFGRENVSSMAGDRYKFRTPSLLNVELTAPYGHAGQFSTLRSMLDHYKNASANLMAYDIMDHVTDSDLIATQIGNESDVLMTLAPSLGQPINFNTDHMLAFMQALTAESARDLSGIIPATVPSGASIDL